MPTAATLVPVPMLDFQREYQALRGEALAAIAAVCDSQRFILGPEVTRFEQAAAAALHVPHAIGCSSGTDALWLALAALNIGTSTSPAPAFPTTASSANPAPHRPASHSAPGVLTTPFSFFASTSAILRAGARPIFADIDERTFNLSPEAARLVLARQAQPIAAILPVHLYGQCADMDALTVLARSAGVPVIEDAAQAFGALWNGQPAGGLGEIAAFSFYPTKNLAAFGDAGMVTTRDPALAERTTMLRAHGMRRRYVHDELGWNCRLDSLQAAVLEVKLRYVDAGNHRRRELAALYADSFRSAGLAAASTADGIVLPWTDPRATHVFHQYVVRAPRRDGLRAYLTEQQIGTEVYYPQPLHLQHALADLGYQPGDLPVSERAAAEVLALPLYPGLREEEVRCVVEAIRRFYA